MAGDLSEHNWVVDLSHGQFIILFVVSTFKIKEYNIVRWN